MPILTKKTPGKSKPPAKTSKIPLSTAAQKSPKNNQPEIPVDDWKKNPTLRNAGLSDLIRRERILFTESQRIIDDHRAIRAQIEALVETAGVRKIVVDDVPVVWVPPGMTRRLDRGLLVVHGVDPEVIEASMKETPRKGYMKIGGAGAAEGGE